MTESQLLGDSGYTVYLKVCSLFVLGILAFSAAASGSDEPVEETRGVSMWYTSYQTKEKADAALERLEKGGFNTVYGMVYWYRAYYPSQMFETADWLTDDFDPVAYMIEQCHQRGWQFFAWFVNARVSRTDAEKYADWLLVDVEGNRHRERLDYLIPEVRDQERRRMLEFARMYPHVDGLQFDYIRLPFERDYSYSEGAREAFEADSGVDPLELVTQPDRFEPEQHKRLSEKWLAWRKEQITGLVRDVHREAKAINPRMLVGAAVMSPRSRIENAKQDWPRWVQEGYVDFVKTMYYANNPDNYANHLAFWKEACGEHFDRAVLPLGGSPRWLGEDGAQPERVVPLIERAREQGARGFFFFRHGTMPDELIEVLADGPFEQPARPFRLAPTDAPPPTQPSNDTPVSAGDVSERTPTREPQQESSGERDNR